MDTPTTGRGIVSLDPWLAARPAAPLGGLLAGQWPPPALAGTVAGVRLTAALWGVLFALCFRALAWPSLTSSRYCFITGEAGVSAAITLLAALVGWLIASVLLSPVGRLNLPPLVGLGPLTGMVVGLALAVSGLTPGRVWLAGVLVLPPLAAWLGLGFGALTLGRERARRLALYNLAASLLALVALALTLLATPSLLSEIAGSGRPGTPLGRGLQALLSLEAQGEDDLLLARLHSADAAVFVPAAEALGAARSEAAVPALLEALERDDEEIQEAAVVALLSIASVRALDGLRDAERGLPSSLRSLAWRRMEADPRSADELLQASRTGTEAQRGEALARLVSSAKASDVPALLRQLQDSDRSARAAACHALARLRPPQAREPLAAVLRDGEPNVRLAAATALLALGDLRGLPILIDQGGSADVRCQMYGPLLGRLRTPEATRALLQLAAGTDEHGLEALEKALREQGPVALPVLRQAAAHQDAGVRSVIARLLRESGAPQALAAARQAESVVDTGTWVARVRQARRAHRPVVPVLLEVLRRGPADLHPWARAVLRSVSYRERAALDAAVRDPDPEVCLAALAAHPASADFALLYRAADPRVRAAAIRLGREIPHQGREDALFRTLRSDPSPEVRRAAAAALSPATRSRPALSWALLHDPSVEVRLAAAETLSHLSGVDALASALHCSDQRVARAAYRALCRSGGDAADRALAAAERRRRLLEIRSEVGM